MGWSIICSFPGDTFRSAIEKANRFDIGQVGFLIKLNGNFIQYISFVCVHTEFKQDIIRLIDQQWNLRRMDK